MYFSGEGLFVIVKAVVVSRFQQAQLPVYESSALFRLVLYYFQVFGRKMTIYMFSSRSDVCGC